MKKIISLLIAVSVLFASPMRGAYNPLFKQFTIANVPIGTSGSPVDRGSMTLPPNVTKWLPTRIIVRAVGASSTMAAGTLDIRTASGGGGSSLLLSPTALTSLTGTADLIQSLTVGGLTSAVTSTTVYARQTVDSANVGTISITIEFIDLSL